MIQNMISAMPNIKMWKYTPDGVKSSQTVIVKDDWLKEHRNDEDLFIVMFTTTNISPELRALYNATWSIAFAYNGNAPYSSNNNESFYGRTQYFENASQTSQNSYHPLNSTNRTVYILKVNSDGELIIPLSTIVKLLPVEYIIMAFVRGEN